MSELELRVDALNREAWERMLSDPEAALSVAESALAEAESASYAAGLAEARLNVGWCMSYLSKNVPAILAFQASLEGFEALGDALGAMKALNALGVAYHELGRFDRAMDYYTRSLEEARRRGNRWREAVTLNNIGEICLDLGEQKEALDYFLRAYETVPDDREAELVSNVLLNIGTTFHRMENWPLAREFTEKALVIAEEADDRYIASQCWLALGKVASSQDRPELAESYCGKALALAEALRNDKLRVSVLLELGAVISARGDAAAALGRFSEALAGAEAIGSKALVQNAYERLSAAYEAQGDHRTALDYYRRHARYEREILNEDATRKIKNVTVQYEVEKSRQEAEIYRLRNIELKEKTEALEEANRHILQIADIGRRITSSLDLDTVISTLYESLERSMDTTVFGLGVYSEEDDSLEWRYFSEYGKRMHRPVQRIERGKSFAAWCIVNRKPVVIGDADREYRDYLAGPRSTRGRPGESLIFLPLQIDERVIGVITVQSYVKGAYSEGDLRLLEALSSYVAIAVENGLIHDRLEEINRSILGEKRELEAAALRSSHQANHDSLTGLPNRRLLFELLQKSFDIASRNGTKVGVVYVDLDNFKPINDRFGHAAGDRALVTMSERLKEILRSSDTVARVGGDEFIAVLTNARGRPDIEPAAAKILEECSRPIDFGGESRSLSLSIGIAIFPDDGSSIEELVNLADAAMYSVKHARKNGMAFASALAGGSRA